MVNKYSQVKHFIEYAINKGCVISVWDGDQWLLSRSVIISDLIEVCTDLDDEVILLVNMHSKPLCRLTVCCNGTIKASSNTWLDKWVKVYSDQFDYNCYQCDKPTNWLAPDSRCGDCTRYTPEEIRGDV